MKNFKKFFKKDSIKSRGALLIGATVMANFFNFVYNAYLGRSISIEDFATISLLGSFFGLADLPINALGRSVTHKAAFYLGKYKVPAKGFWSFMRKKAIIGALVVTVLWLAAIPLFYSFFKLDSILPLLSISPIWFFGVMSSVDGGYVKGNLMFGRLAVVGIIDSLVRLLTVIVLAESGYGKYVYLGLPISALTTFLFVAYFASRIKVPEVRKVEKHSFPLKFFGTSALTKASATVYLTADIILAKHFLPADQAGQYALLSLFGKIVYFAGSLFSQFILPMVSHGEGQQADSANVFKKLLLCTFFASFSAFLALWVSSNSLMPMIFGSKILPILPFVGLYAGGMVAFTVATNIIAYHQIKGWHLLPTAGFVLALIELLLILIFHRSVGEIATSVAFSGFASLIIAVFLHLLYGRFVILWNNVLDFFELFRPISVPSKGTRILVFNWRDTKHLWAGGAEVYIHELSKELTKMGHHVTIFCGNDSKNKRSEIVNGVRVLRRGGFYTVYVWAALYYIFKFRNKFDVIIDSENGIPFFSPIFSRKSVILLIHHVHQDIFMQHLKFPLSYIAKAMEGKLMPFVYRNCQVVTVSQSSKEEIVKAKLAKENNIEIVNPGIVIEHVKTKKSKTPTLLYLGRLKPYKNVDIAIKAFKKVEHDYSNAKLTVAGEGESMQSLKALAQKLKIEKKVVFLGKISENLKKQLLAESWIALQPSTVEGWGITVLEANSYRTPVIASNVNGLKDSIVNGKTGVLVELKNVSSMEKSIRVLFSNRKMRERLSIGAYEWSKEFSWEKNAQRFLGLMENLAEGKAARKYAPTISRPAINKN